MCIHFLASQGGPMTTLKIHIEPPLKVT